MTLTHIELIERQVQDLSKDLDRLRLDMKFMRDDISMRERVDVRLKGDIEILENRLAALAERKAPLKV